MFVFSYCSLRPCRPQEGCLEGRLVCWLQWGSPQTGSAVVFAWAAVFVATVMAPTAVVFVEAAIAPLVMMILEALLPPVDFVEPVVPV